MTAHPGTYGSVWAWEHDSAFFLLNSAKEEPGLEASKPCCLQASIKGMQAALQQKVPLTKLSKKSMYLLSRK